MSGRWVSVTGAVAIALLPALAACGGNGPGSDGTAHPPASSTVPQSVKDCQDQWHDVAESVLGLDQDTNPSSLASRWTTVIATVDYYRTSTEVKDCQATIEAQQQAITALRQFSERLRPYDMTYQLDRVRAAVDLYLHDPVPSPAKGTNGHRVKAPTHAQVAAALATLTAEAAAANADLQPGWDHLASITLEDASTVSDALDDLDALAQAGEHWTRCQQALQVIVSAERAQEGLLGSPEDQASPAS